MRVISLARNPHARAQDTPYKGHTPTDEEEEVLKVEAKGSQRLASAGSKRFASAVCMDDDN